jgi:hypothetical protein
MGEKPRFRTLTNGPFIMALPRTKTRHGLRTGDFARAVILGGKHSGTRVGRVIVRSSGSVHVRRADGVSGER